MWTTAAIAEFTGRGSSSGGADSSCSVPDAFLPSAAARELFSGIWTEGSLRRWCYVFHMCGAPSRRSVLSLVAASGVAGMAGRSDGVGSEKPAHTVSVYLHNRDAVRDVTITVEGNDGTVAFERDYALSDDNEAHEDATFPGVDRSGYRRRDCRWDTVRTAVAGHTVSERELGRQ